jgi:NAD-dependent SIR2 family protein deacetylase
MKQKSLTKQITLLASLIKKSESFVALTRAGISASIGLTDYASKAAKNVVVENALAEDNLKGKCLAMNAEPTLSHRV